MHIFCHMYLCASIALLDPLLPSARNLISWRSSLARGTCQSTWRCQVIAPGLWIYCTRFQVGAGYLRPTQWIFWGLQDLRFLVPLIMFDKLQCVQCMVGQTRYAKRCQTQTPSGILRLALLCLLKCRAHKFFVMLALKCSSWTAINQGTSGRAFCGSIGYDRHPSVWEANQLMERNLSWKQWVPVEFVFIKMLCKLSWDQLFGDAGHAQHPLWGRCASSWWRRRLGEPGHWSNRV